MPNVSCSATSSNITIFGLLCVMFILTIVIIYLLKKQRVANRRNRKCGTGETQRPETGESQGPKIGENQGTESGEIQGPETEEIQGQDTGEIQGPKTKEIQRQETKEIQGPETGEIQVPETGEIQEPETEEIQGQETGEIQGQETATFAGVASAAPMSIGNLDSYRLHMSSPRYDEENELNIYLRPKGSSEGNAILHVTVPIEKSDEFTVADIFSETHQNSSIYEVGNRDCDDYENTRLNLQQEMEMSDSSQEYETIESCLEKQQQTSSDYEQLVMKTRGYLLPITTRCSSDGSL